MDLLSMECGLQKLLLIYKEDLEKESTRCETINFILIEKL